MFCVWLVLVGYALLWAHRNLTWVQGEPCSRTGAHGHTAPLQATVLPNILLDFDWILALRVSSKNRGGILLTIKGILGPFRLKNFKGRHTCLSCGKWCIPVGLERPDFSLSFPSRRWSWQRIGRIRFNEHRSENCRSGQRVLDSESAPSLSPVMMWDPVCFFPSHPACLSFYSWIAISACWRDADFGGVLYSALAAQSWTLYSCRHCQLWTFLQLAVSPYS